MTNKEARQILRGDFSEIELGDKSASQLFDEAFKMAIDALEVVEKNRKVIEYCGTCSKQKTCIKSDL